VPLWLLGMDAGLNHARLGLAPLAGLALGLAGVGLLSAFGEDSDRGISGWGVVIILAAAAGWALGTILARRVTIPASPALASGMQLLSGGTALLALSAATGEFGSLHLAGISAASWLALAYLTVVGSIAYVNPVIAVLLGTLILNERLTPAMFGGGALIVSAVILVVRRSPRVH
jgi:drug/metabolite transporter (DMT)-like permease